MQQGFPPAPPPSYAECPRDGDGPCQQCLWCHSVEHGRAFSRCRCCRERRRAEGWHGGEALEVDCPSCGFAVEVRLVPRAPEVFALSREGPTPVSGARVDTAVAEQPCPHCERPLRLLVVPRAPAISVSAARPAPGFGPAPASPWLAATPSAEAQPLATD